MNISDSTIIDSIMAPIVGHHLCQGYDVRYQADFEIIENEISKLTSCHREHKTDWELIKKIGYDILINHSKDLRVICWFSLAILKTGNKEGVVFIFDLLSGFINKYFDVCFPIKLTSRLAVLSWLFDRIEVNANNFAEKLSKERLLTVINSIESCCELLNLKFGSDAPFLQPKLHELKNILYRKESEVIIPVISKHQTGLASADSISETTITCTVTEENSSIRIARGLQEQSRLLIPWLLNKDLADPRAYLLTRGCAWLQIVSAPIADEQKRTRLKPLPMNKLQEYQQRLIAGEFSTLIPELEISLSKAPFWLDGHYWCAQALEGLGFNQMAEHLRQYLYSFLSKFTSIVELYFDDGTPFASEPTKIWLESDHDSTSNRPDIFSTHSSLNEMPWITAYEVAQNNIVKDRSCLKQEILALQLMANSVGSMREKVMWLLMLVKLCQQYLRHDLALHILEEIDLLVNQFHIYQWEPALAKDVLLLWLHSLEKGNFKNQKDKISEIKNKLYRMDISIAF